MNNVCRRHTGPVRQLSLQQPPRYQQPLRRQRSTEDERTSKFHSNNPVTTRSGLASNLNSPKSKYANVKEDYYSHPQLSILERPKVRVAWSDKNNQSTIKNNSEVEVVAKQIPTVKVNRPSTGRNIKNMMNRYSLGEKATILYSRQELAERLRLAWRQRQENKSNIDIFLAHNTVEERCDSVMSNATPPIPTPSPVPTTIVETTKNELKDSKIQNGECSNRKMVDVENFKLDEKVNYHRYQMWFPPFETKKPGKLESHHIKKNPNNSTPDNDNNKDNKVDEIIGDKMENPPKEKKLISIHCNNWNTSISTDGIVETVNQKLSSGLKEPDFSQARLKRANFKSGLNKAFVEPVTEKPPTPRMTSRANSFHDAPKNFRRTNSAPPQRKTQVNIIIDTNSEVDSLSSRIIDNDLPRRVMSASDPPQLATKNNQVNNQVRPHKSAVVLKKRIKFSKKRSTSVGSRDGKDDGGTKNKAKNVKNNKGGTFEPKCVDVVTMVSLVSSAESESEIDENSPRDDKLICELRNKLSTAPIIKSSNGLTTTLRKPFKSVSFQQDSFEIDSPPRLDFTRDDLRSSSYYQMRYSGLDSTMIAWNADVLEPEPMPPLTDREKRCLAVPIGDSLDKKPKLIRCKSAVVTPRIIDADKRPDTSQTFSQADLRNSFHSNSLSGSINLRQGVGMQENSIISKAISTSSIQSPDINLEKDKTITAEPYCQTPKEKECWHLYRKMCDKGVFVSFDTVLRGMLTPTEYRLRQKQLSQNC